MAKAEYSTSIRLPVQAVWDFVQDMDNWATFVTGYQTHEKQSDVDSTWVLKGDVGVLTRKLHFRVKITEWNGPERVSFELEGENEPMSGQGCFTLSSGDAAAVSANATSESAPTNPRRGFLARWLEALARFFYRLVYGRVERAEPAPQGVGVAHMNFRLSLEPGGPMAPMVNAMIQPMLVPAAENLADKIMAELEARRDAHV